MSITWKAAADLAVGDLVYVRPLGGPDKVLAVFQETAERSGVHLTRLQVEEYGFVARLSHELVAVAAAA